MNSIGDLVRRRLAEMGWSQHKLAQALGMRDNQLSALLHRTPRPATLGRLAAALGIEVGYFFGDDARAKKPAK